MAELIQIAQLQESRWEERLLNLWNYPKYTVTPGKKKKEKQPKNQKQPKKQQQKNQQAPRKTTNQPTRTPKRLSGNNHRGPKRN